MIAKEAGVTPTTVSCVLNNTRPVSQKVRQRVMEVVERLNYVPDVSARSMQGKGTKQIAIMVDSIKNPFLAELVYSIEKAGIKKGFFFNICGKMDLKKYVPNIIARKIDAVYLCSEIKDSEVQYVRQLLDNGVKVLTGSHFKSFESEVSRIDMATGDAVGKAVELLYEKGHRKIAFLNTFRTDSELDNRLNVYFERAKTLGIEPIAVSPENTLPATIENGRELFERLWQTRKDVTAVVGINDLVTLGAMDEAKRRGVQVPSELSFVGIDGIELSRLVDPPLTTFQGSAKELGYKAFEMLYEMIEKGTMSTFTYPMQYMAGGTVSDITKKEKI